MKLETQTHPFATRLFHWCMAAAILLLIGSGWRIYNSAPIFGFTFPEQLTLGGDGDDALALHNDPGVASAIAWHFAAMWLLAASYAGFMLWNLFNGHFRRDFFPVGPKSFLRDFIAAATFKLEHRLGEYNVVQRVAYWVALGSVAMMLLSGLAIWKPVQFQWITALLGGYDFARIVHFSMMAGIVGFVLVHLALVALVPSTLPPMVTGRAPEHDPHAHPEGAAR